MVAAFATPAAAAAAFDAAARPVVHHAQPSLGGAVAQLGERLTGSQEVDGSIPFSSTIFIRLLWLSCN
jgi:hypothetical protein